MNSADRIAHHRELCHGYTAAFANGPELGRVAYPESWRVSPSATLWGPSLQGGARHPWGKSLEASGLTPSERTTLEFQLFWHYIPDFRVVESGEGLVSEAGFANWNRFEGTSLDGVRFGFHEVEHVYTDDAGDVIQLDVFIDWTELGPILGLVTGQSPESFSWDEYRAVITRFHAER